MNIDIRLDEADHQRVVRRLMELRDAGKNLKPVMTEIGGELLDTARQSFEDEAAPDGTPWTPLSAVTLLEREEKGFVRDDGTAQMLQRTRHLLRSIQVSDVTNTSVAVGTNVVYAATHQFGRDAKPGRGVPFAGAAIPARPFLGAGPDLTDRIVAAIQRHLGF